MGTLAEVERQDRRAELDSIIAEELTSETHRGDLLRVLDESGFRGHSLMVFTTELVHGGLASSRLYRRLQQFGRTLTQQLGT